MNPIIEGMKLKQQLEHYLQQEGITATQLAKKSGVSKQVLSLWLSGRSPRKIEQVKKVADALGISVDQLCFGSGSMISMKSTLMEHEDEINAGVFEVVLRRIQTNKT